MSQKIYIASKEVLDGWALGQEHLYLYYDPNLDNDNDPTSGTGMKILRGDSGVNYGQNNIVVTEVRGDAQASLDWLFDQGETIHSQNFRILFDSLNLSAVWAEMSNFAMSLGDYDSLSEIYESELTYSPLGPNSNSVVNSILNANGLNFRDITPYADGSTSVIQDPSEFPGHMGLLDGSGDNAFTAYVNTGGFTETTVFYKRGGNDTITVRMGAELEINALSQNNGFTTIILNGLIYNNGESSWVGRSGFSI